MVPKGWQKWTWSTLVDQVHSLCEIDEETGCWIWPKGKDKDGYPKLYIDGKHWRGNRAILFAITGELHDQSMHSCDRPPCMFPGHLSWGTNSKNSIDAFEKGRRSSPNIPLSGDKNGRSKLSNAQREEIVQRSLTGERVADLATAYAVSKETIRILLRKRGIARPTGRPRSK